MSIIDKTTINIDSIIATFSNEGTSMRSALWRIRCYQRIPSNLHLYNYKTLSYGPLYLILRIVSLKTKTQINPN